MGKPFILAIDQGTTGSTVLALSAQAQILTKSYREFPQHFPQPGWVEHDAEEIWQSVCDCMAELFEKSDLKPADCAGIGITNQRETTVVWERDSGLPVHRAIVWQDRRSAEQCAALKAEGHEALFRARSGLLLDPYFSGTKLQWLFQNDAALLRRARAGELCFGTIDSFLVWRLSGGKSHITDASNASRTLLFDIGKGHWDSELCQLLSVPEAILPEVTACSGHLAKTNGLESLPDGTPIAGMAGDQQAALFGQTCFDKGDAKCTYGTGAFLLVNTGTQPLRSEHGVLSTVAWKLGSEMTYALEGSAFIAGAAVQWLRDGLGLISDASEMDPLASSVPDSGELVFVPALTGLGAPHWDPHARGMITGITRASSRAHLARATLEGIAFQIYDLARAMRDDLGEDLRSMRVDGGAAKSDFLMQFQADLLALRVDRPESVETTALGAAYLAGLAVGFFPTLEDIRKVHRIDKCFNPVMKTEEREKKLKLWSTALKRVMATA
ncbi:MAG: glycerol kinase GlpK [Myxococcales bacterium]|nr:MAG: glycerol kinase GlpK [Myxococcales bacterium]